MVVDVISAIFLCQVEVLSTDAYFEAKGCAGINCIFCWP